MAGRRTGLLASGNRSAAPSRELSVVPVAGATRARGVLHPVTVAGPRRSLTGLPLTTDRLLRRRVYPLRTRHSRD